MIIRSLKNLAALFLGTLVLFVLLEAVFRFFGAPGANRYIEKVVIKENLTRSKPAGEIRVFTYGESTMFGAHYAEVSNPAKWVEAYLKDFLPSHKIRVVNFARMGKSVDFIADSFRDTLIYKPDIALFYMGHNVFLHDNKKHEVEAAKKKFGARLREMVRHSYFISTVQRWVIKASLKRKGDTAKDSMEYAQIETPPSGIGTENATPRDGERYKENIGFFKQKLAEITALIDKHKINALFFKPVGNLKDFAPWHSVHMRLLDAYELKLWNELYEQGKEAQAKGNWVGALRFFHRANEIDSTYADLSFRLGQLHFQQGDIMEARQFFEQARDNDAIIFRATNDIENIFEEWAGAGKLQLIDTEKVVIPEVPGGIPGEPVIEDNVHFSPKGHALISRKAVQEIAKRNWIAPFGAWQFQLEKPYEELAKQLGIDDEFLFTAYLRLVNYFGSRFENRVRVALRALEIKPDHPRALRYLAWTYWLMGQKDKALEVYERLGQSSPADLKEVLMRQPEIRKAIEAPAPKAAVPAVQAA